MANSIRELFSNRLIAENYALIIASLTHNIEGKYCNVCTHYIRQTENCDLSIHPNLFKDGLKICRACDEYDLNPEILEDLERLKREYKLLHPKLWG